MNKKELIQYLKNNLTIQINADRDFNLFGDTETKLEVILKLEDEIISKDNTTISDSSRYM